MKKIYSFLSIFIAFWVSCQPPQPSIEALKKNIETEFKDVEGTFALAFQEVGNPSNIILINEKEDFHAASTMKTPVMIELYKQAQQGKFSLDDSILVKNEFYSIVDSSIYSMDIDVDSEGKLYEKIGTKLPVRSLMYDMITYSSNLATNILIDLVDARKVTQSMREMGMEDILVLRGVEDIKAFEKNLSNRTTAYDLMLMYKQIAQKEVVSSEACDEMISILLEQHFNNIIPANIPEGVKVAHKTGSITGVRHDSGLVILPDGRQYALVLLSKELEDPKAGIEKMAKVSKMIYDWVR